MAGAAAITDRGGKGEEQQVAPGNKGVWQPALREIYCGLAGKRRVAEPSEHAEIDQVVFAELSLPRGKRAAQATDHGTAASELNAVALAIVEAHRLDRGKTLQRPSKASRRILSSG